MHKTMFVSALTLALAVSGTAFAQSTTTAAKPSSPDAVKQQRANLQSALTTKQLTTDLQKAGFTDVNVIADAFLIQAKTKDGNPVLMTLGPKGVTALEMSKASAASQPETTGQALAESKPAAEPLSPVKQ